MQVYAAVMAITGWLAVILQGYLILANRTASVAETIIRFFSFFTILTNILAALCATSVWMRGIGEASAMGAGGGVSAGGMVGAGDVGGTGSRMGAGGEVDAGSRMGMDAGAGNFFSRPSTLTATTVYILIVGLVYNIILRLLWEPQGLQLWVDEWLHSVMPVLFLLFWLIFVPKCGLPWKGVLTWLIYPFVYLLFIVLRGALSGFYPYPFIDINKITYHDALMNAGAVMIGFLVLSFVLIGVGKMGRK